MRKWLGDIGTHGRQYEDRINYYRQAYAGDLAGFIGKPDRSLLSDKALGMVAKCAGYPDPSLGGQDARAYVFNINTWPSSDMTYLQADDGRTVLIIPGSRQPLREYRNLDAMRADLRQMVQSGAGQAVLDSHFSIYNQRDGKTYQGVEKWLRDIQAGGYDERIAYKATQINEPIFREQLYRARDADLGKLHAMRVAEARTDAELDLWIQSFGAANSIFARLRDGRSMVETLQGGAIGDGRQRERRAFGWPAGAQACAPRQGSNSHRDVLPGWRESLCTRLYMAMLNLLGPQEDTGSDERGPAPHEVPQAVETDSMIPPHPCPELDLASLDTPNEFGFLEGRHINTIYLMQRYTPDSIENPAPMVLAPQLDDWHIANSVDVNGNAIEAYLSEESAIRASLDGDDGFFRLLRVDTTGMRTVSFGNNRRHNADYQRLQQEQLQPIVDDYPAGVQQFIRSRFQREQDDLVHLSLEGQRPDIVEHLRTVRIEAGMQVASTTPRGGL
ncbi:dermonecrotic toxin domain-containing protein [Herbaspirillum sp. YR522]|uniref:dermonecrotic toxin domain-containing protein n=1 Tax=Herbaspirillum sp. YR522 TaxID=1144342 RepID=UPI0035105BC2